MNSFKKIIATGLTSLTILGSVAAAGVISPIKNTWDFAAPSAVIEGANGSLLVADSAMHNIVSLSGGGGSLLAGFTLPSDSSGSPVGGLLDASAELALFSAPTSLVRWGGGIAVSDRDNHMLRLIINGEVKTLAGSGACGNSDGAAASASFNTPTGLATDKDGILYIADSGNGSIRALDKSGNVSTLVSGLVSPHGLCWFGGALYATDAGSHKILRISNKEVTVLAGSNTADEDGVLTGGFSDGGAAAALFSYPLGLTVSDGVVYVADTGNSAIRKISNGYVSTLAAYDGALGELYPASPAGLLLCGKTLYISDPFAGKLLELNTEYQLFCDVPADKWFAQSVSLAYTSGIATGSSSSYFLPNSSVTRGQFLSMLYRYDNMPVVSEHSFSDLTSSHYAYDASCWAVENGIICSEQCDTLSPEQTVTRQELVLALYRLALCKGLSLDGVPLDSYADCSELSGEYAKAMSWAVKNGIICGTGEGRLEPNEAATRAQAVSVLHRLSDAVDATN